MYKFSEKSLKNLENVHPNLVWCCHQVLHTIDITVLSGWRGEEEQNLLFADDKSQLEFPRSKHNHMEDGKPLSLAVDIAPWTSGGIPWLDFSEFRRVYIEFNKQYQRGLQTDEFIPGFTLQWGGHWASLKDGPHFELQALTPDEYIIKP